MPIYEYECRGCGEQFELLVLKGTVAACPACQGQDLEQLLSGFAVTSDQIRRTNVKRARAQYAASKTTRDKKVAELEEIKEHSAPPPTPRKKK
jgi:putative FmdB family regulatory protein